MENATYVFKNGKVITVNDNDDIVEAVAINGNKIVYVGEEAMNLMAALQKKSCKQL